MVEVKIGQNDQNKRLDNFVKKYLNHAPLSLIYKLFRKKDIKVNKKPQGADYITKVGDTIQIYITREQEDMFIKGVKVSTSNNKNFEVIYEDENVLIVNKEAGLLVYDGEEKANANDDTLIKQVLNYLIQNGSYDVKNESTFVPSLAHRIDRNTSGLIVIGKTNIALQELFKAFIDHGGIEKKYVALVCGRVTNDGTIDAPLIKNEKTKIVNVDERNGLPAISKYSSKQVFKDCSLVDVNILTGRTHQIRVHMKYINHPLVGDHKYGNANSDELANKYKMKGYFLHAQKLCFHNLEGKLAYLNGQVFVAPLFKWQIGLIERLNVNKGE